MQAAGASAWPARWQTFFDEVMADHDAHGCPFADPAFYDDLNARYGAPGDELPLYREAAAAVAKEEPLARLLSLLVRAMRDRTEFVAECKEFKQPPIREEGKDPGRAMLTALAIAAYIPYTHDLLARRGMPPTVIRDALRQPERGIAEYRVRHGGAAGFILLDWCQRTVDGHLFPIGRLEAEIGATFKGHAKVFRHRDGRVTVLAHELPLHKSGLALGAFGCEDEAGSRTPTVTETKTAYRGFPFGPDGRVLPDPVTLPKAEWTLVLQDGDPTIGLHIPPLGKLLPEAVDASLADIKKFVAAYFPDYHYRAFTCYSWLMDPQLDAMLGPDANIVRFSRRFTRLTRKADGNAIYYFAFRLPAPVPPETLPEDTRLWRALKAHYLSGHVIYEDVGFFLP